jgi:hypothetical protein
MTIERFKIYWQNSVPFHLRIKFIDVQSGEKRLLTYGDKLKIRVFGDSYRRFETTICSRKQSDVLSRLKIEVPLEFE